MRWAALESMQESLKSLGESLVFRVELPSNYTPKPRTITNPASVSKRPVVAPIELGTFEQTASKHDFQVKPDGRIFYKGQALKKLKATSKQGKLLILLLEAKDHIVTYDDIKKLLRPGDLYKGLHDLKYGLIRSLKNEGIKVAVIAKWGEAYCLIDVE
jgi:hypothetical protein